MIEERLPHTEATEPELLAHHYTEAKQPQKAIPLWQKAGSLALNRMALAEAIAHLNRALDLVAALPSSAERDGKELDLRTLLSIAWMALRGWPAQEVWDSLHPALALATSLRRNDPLLPILWGLWINVLCRGWIAKSLRWVTQMLEAAEAYHDQDFLLAGHTAAVSYFWIGELIKAREHADRVLALYSEERHGHFGRHPQPRPENRKFDLYGPAGLDARLPQANREDQDAKDAHARRLGHPFNLGFALTIGAQAFDYRSEPDELLKRVEEAERVGREHSLPVLIELQVPLHSGIALIRKGQFAEGMASLRAGLAIWRRPDERRT